MPEILDITKEQFDTYHPVWALWKATGKRHLLSELMEEPDEAWNVVLKIENAFHAVKGTLKNG